MHIENKLENCRMYRVYVALQDKQCEGWMDGFIQDLNAIIKL